MAAALWGAPPAFRPRPEFPFSYSYSELPAGRHAVPPGPAQPARPPAAPAAPPEDAGSAVRRLRHSIFSSLKLPRKVSKMAAHQVLGGTLGRGERAAQPAKRKSAVELLQESKAFYVKSETVLDRKQELPLRASAAPCASPPAGGTLPSRRGHGEALQSQLRRLLGPAGPPSPAPEAPRPYHTERRPRDWERRGRYNSGTFSGNSSSGTSGSKGQVKSDPEQWRADRAFFPDCFVPPDGFSASLSAGSPLSSPEKLDARRILSVADAYDSDYGALDARADGDLEDFLAISPPAEYAAAIHSHKSLPDLHRQAAPPRAARSPAPSSRGSSHSRRSRRDEPRSGSSARDSGGSSGPGSAPAPSPRPPRRRDSGSSTQHSAREPHYCAACGPPLAELRVCAPPQFQDGAPPLPAPPAPAGYGALVGIHFRASIPPLQFQDHFSGRREAGARESRHALARRPGPPARPAPPAPLGQEPEGSPPGLGNFKRQRCLRYKQRRPILRSKSDMSDRYWREPPPAPGSPRPALQRFFEQLGLPDAEWRELLARPGSPEERPASASPAPSDSSRADSALLQSNGDYTVQGAAPRDKLYRSCEPPSIVERNARIIKWLCNCRKLQAL